MSTKNPVRTLNPEVARKIAAGEVIDRPNAIVRELMDNAIDSGADSITVDISGGGIEKVRVQDNGFGMTREDLENCAKPHATSKIATETDLLNLTTLGFRGEALASMAAVSRLSINSGGNLMRASVTEDHLITPTTPLSGTIVMTEGLFENFPARRVFLKRPASEATLCKNMFVEKAVPNPHIAFRFLNEGVLRLDLQKGQSLAQRFVKAMEFSESQELFAQVEGKDSGSNPDFSFEVIIGEPGVYRSNKKDILIFVNGRRIQEYSLVQAVEYGSQGYFPNGTYPVAAVFIHIKPALVDFNIHPAKREVRFKDSSALHHALSMAIKAHFAQWTNRTMKFHSEKLSETIIQSEFNELSNAENKPSHSLSYKIHETGRNGFSRNESSMENSTEKLTKTSSWHDFSKAGTKSYSWNQEIEVNNTAAEKKVPFTSEKSDEISKQANENEVSFFMDKVISAYNSFSFEEEYSKSKQNNQISLVKKENSENFEPSALREISENKASETDTNRISENDADSENNINPEKTYTDTKLEKDETFERKSIFKNEIENAYSSKILGMTMKAASVFSSGERQESQWKADSAFHFLGSALGTFLIAEKEGVLYIIDKHAANERMLFDRIMENQNERQNLLIPYTIKTESDEEDEYLESMKDELDRIGFSCENKGNGTWEVSTINLRWTGSEEDFRKAVLETRSSPRDLIYSIAAMTACKAAVKDGWKLEDEDAKKIAEAALELKDPHCPHGRPVYTCITREQLFDLVRRT